MDQKHPAPRDDRLLHGVIDHTADSARRVFGRWSFNAETGDLCEGGTTTQLQPQVAKLLGYFLAHQDRLITRDELIAAVWDNRVVSDDAIQRCISILRQLLSPDDKHSYIETVARRGYRAHFPPAPGAEVTARRGLRGRHYLTLAALAGVAAIILYVVISTVGDSLRDTREAPSEKPPVVAVLPFASTGRAADSQLFAKGVHDDLLTQLTRLQSIRVISSTSVQEYRNVARNIRKIGEELGADAILEGSVQTAENRIRINVQLIDARTDTHLWADSYDRDLSPANIFEVQSEIARAIAEPLNAALTIQDDRQLKVIPTDNMAAYRAFHRAMELRTGIGNDLTAPEYRQALQEAVELDPTFSRAWAELVTNLAYLHFYSGDSQWTERAEQALQALKAVAPDSADYLIGQAGYVYYVLKDYDRAHDILSAALAMNPSDVHAVQLKSWIERRRNRFDAYVELLREARRLDPRNPQWTDSLLNGLVMTHHYDEASAEIEKAPFESYTIGYYRILLRFREHRDVERLQSSMDELCRSFDEPGCGWEAHVANRDYPGAWNTLQADQREPGDLFIGSFFEGNQRRLFTFWLMNEHDALAQELLRWGSRLERYRDAPADFFWSGEYLATAILAGAQGNVSESERLIERWYREQPVDWAERAQLRSIACRALGMTGSTHAAIRCIRDGLTEASYVMPFWEPYLPFYDSLRNEPEFADMLVDIGG